MPNSLPSAGRITKLLDKFEGKRILVLGDLMLDHFIRGRVRRISPEAPVPVVTVTDESHAPGGAGNVCSNLAALGGRVTVFSVVGNDSVGNLLISDLRSRRIDTSGVHVDPSRVTTQKTRVVAEHQQVVRFDRETPQSLPRASQIQLIDRLERAMKEAHALVISDYGKGIVTPLVLKRTINLAARRGVPILVDPKVEHFRRYKGVDCITPNLQEAWGGMRLLPQTHDEAIFQLGRRIIKALGVRSLLITRGEKGMTLFESKGGRNSILHIPTQAREVFDVTGAGDTVISVMALSLASGASYAEAAATANLAAGIVVGKLGTATVTVPEIRRALRVKP